MFLTWTWLFGPFFQFEKRVYPFLSYWNFFSLFFLLNRLLPFSESLVPAEFVFLRDIWIGHPPLQPSLPRVCGFPASPHFLFHLHPHTSPFFQKAVPARRTGTVFICFFLLSDPLFSNLWFSFFFFPENLFFRRTQSFPFWPRATCFCPFLNPCAGRCHLIFFRFFYFFLPPPFLQKFFFLPFPPKRPMDVSEVALKSVNPLCLGPLRLSFRPRCPAFLLRLSPPFFRVNPASFSRFFFGWQLLPALVFANGPLPPLSHPFTILCFSDPRFEIFSSHKTTLPWTNSDQTGSSFFLLLMMSGFGMIPHRFF